MGDITNIVIDSAKAKNGVIEVGIGESIPVSAIVTGTNSDDHKIVFEILRDVPNEDYEVLNFGNNYITLKNVSFPVNVHKGKWINLDATNVNRRLVLCTKNTKDTLYFKQTVNLNEFGYDGLVPCQITNVVKWREVDIVEDRAEVNFETTGSSYEPYMGTSEVFGIYLVRAYSPDFSHIDAEMEMHIVILSMWQLRDIYLAGIPLYYMNPEYPTDPRLWLPIFQTDDMYYRAINQAIKEFEQRTQLFLTPKRVITNPSENESGIVDIPISALDFEIGYEYLFVKLPHHHVIDLHKMEGWFGSQKVIEWNPTWYRETLDRRAGIIQMVPMMGGIPYHNIAMPVFDFISRIGWPNYLAGFWHVDYTTGWDERKRPLPGHILNALGKLAVIAIVPGISDALTRGISSASVSLDGVSESKSHGIGGMTHLFSARVKQYQDELKEFFETLFKTEIPIPVETV